jgi:hypothetical protein
MKRLLPIALIACATAWAACASDVPNVKGVKRVEVEVQSKTESLVSSFTGKSESVYAASFAIRLADLALREKGLRDYARRNVVVSYCDGIYTVTYERPEDKMTAKDYVVDIDAGTSRILKVDSGR